jgi:replicative DNA helicase
MDGTEKEIYSLESEKSVIGGLLLDNNLLLKVRPIISGVDFFYSLHTLLYEGIESHYDKNIPFDPITISEWMVVHHDKKREEIFQFVANCVSQTYSTDNITAHAEIIKELSVLRTITNTCKDILSNIYTSNYQDSTTILQYAESKIFNINVNHSSNELTSAGSILSTVIDEIEELSSSPNGLVGISSGFQGLDRALAGFQNGDLTILAGRPSMGKTSLALNMVEYIAFGSNKKVAFFSLEMSKNQLIMRLLSSMANVPLQNIRTGNLSKYEWDKITKISTIIQCNHLYIDDSSLLTVGEIGTKCRLLSRPNKLDLIVIDYLQLITTQSPNAGVNRNNDIGAISRQLKILSKQLEIPIIVLSQLNRNLESRTDKRPKLSDLRDSGNIEQDADIVLFIYRDHVYNTESAIDAAEIIISKQRNGPIGTIPISFNPELAKFGSY